MEPPADPTVKTIKDLRHLEGLPAEFTSKVDLILCVRQGAWNLGFPVHKSIISAHSPVLCEAILDLQPPEDQADAQSSELLRLPLVDDNCSAVRAALSSMYESCTWATRSAKARQNGDNLWEASDCVEHIRFAHKYAMNKTLQLQQKTLVHYLCKLCTSETVYSHSPDCAFIFKCIGLAEELVLNEVLQACEAVIVANFEAFRQPQTLAIKLGPSSMLAIATAVFQGQQQVMANTRSARDIYAQQVETFVKINGTLNRKMWCPECKQGMRIELDRQNSDSGSDGDSDSSNGASYSRRLHGRVITHLTPGSQCKWPHTAFKVQGPKITDIQKWIADAHQS